MRSITLLGHDTETLHKLASDCRMSFVTDTEFLDKDNFVTADRHGNLRYIKRDVDSSKRLLPDLATKGRFHLGSKITIMDRTSADFNPIEDHNRKRIIFFGTAEGEFGVVFKVDSDDLSKIKKLQNVLSNNYSNFHSLLKFFCSIIPFFEF
ncbi:DNA damage-binding protein 1, variant 2 [Bonamia ostreae]|uniref:DNA damage-binding protein 1, variant 2 n=1 Tax=Bonamia ostreae TaxID=126728 RepID=A0ABV2APL8_9EUKA